MTARDTDLLKDRSLMGRRADTLERYHEALAAIVVETLATGSGEGKPIGTSRKDSSSSPNPVIGWAEDLLTVETDALRYRAKRLEDWLQRPRPVKRGGKRRCEVCGRGLQRGARFCAGCGTEVKRREGADEGSDSG